LSFDAPQARARGERIGISFAVEMLVALNLHVSAIRSDITGRGGTRSDITGRGVTRSDITGRGVRGIRVARRAILAHISRGRIGPNGAILSIRSQGIVRDDILRGLRAVLSHERVRAHRGAVARDHLVESVLRRIGRGAGAQGAGERAYQRAHEECL